ncbi:MAG: alpha/beta fold hydrolase, partial [Candidatus Helarchaeota archaeon]|nr:alpha/beta fold hydrolase [Candidatus Helarchaeota archaeon]
LSKWEIERKKDLPTYMGVNFLKAIGDWDVVEQLHEIKVPTLIVFGEKDTLTDMTQYSNLLNEKIPNSRLEIIKNAGHGPPTEQTDEYNKITSEFIKKYE